MKNIVALMLVLVTTTLFSQEIDIYYNYASGKIEDSNGTELKSIKKGDKYVLKTRNFNPFRWDISAAVTQRNIAKESLTFFSSFLFTGAVPANAAVAGIQPSHFLQNYLKAIEIHNELNKRDLQCADLSQIALLQKDELLDSFTAYINDPAFRAANPLAEELEVTADRVIMLNDLNTRALAFSKNKCELELLKFVPSRNEITLEIKFNPLKERSGEISGTFSKTLRTENSINVNFSTGIMLSNVIKKAYYTTNPTANTFKLVEDDSSKLVPGIAGMIHLSASKSSPVTFNVGAGIDMEKTPHILTGAGWNISASDIFLSAGYDLGYVDVLSDKYNTSNEYPVAPAVTYKKNFVGGFWFSLTYKL